MTPSQRRVYNALLRKPPRRGQVYAGSFAAGYKNVGGEKQGPPGSLHRAAWMAGKEYGRREQGAHPKR